MQTLEQLKAENLNALKTSLDICQKDKDKSPGAKEQMELIQKQIEHLDELVQIQIVHSTHHLVDMVCQNQPYHSVMAGSVDFKPEDPFVQQLHKEAYPQIARDSFVQKVYESYGYTDKLPTYDEIRSLKASLKRSGLSEEEKVNIRQQITFAERKLGIGNISGGMPYIFPSEVKGDSQIGFSR